MAYEAQSWLRQRYERPLHQQGNPRHHTDLIMRQLTGSSRCDCLMLFPSTHGFHTLHARTMGQTSNDNEQFCARPRRRYSFALSTGVSCCGTDFAYGQQLEVNSVEKIMALCVAKVLTVVVSIMSSSMLKLFLRQ